MSERPLIIYIEDNFDNQRLVQRVLSAHGYKVVIAEDGPSGLALARESIPALMLVDMGIPGLDGYETTTRLRSLRHLDNVPIVALTADTGPGARERALVAGCNGYLVKPIDPRQLPRQIEEFVTGKRETVPLPVEADLLRAHSQKLVERLEQRVRELSMANVELHELDRIKNQFLATLSHELRTPLTSLLGYVELLELGTFGPLSEPQREALNVIRVSGETLSQQLHNLLYFQELRMRSFNLIELHPREVLLPMLELLVVRGQQAGIEVELRLEPVAPLRADREALELLAHHLVDNALKFTNAGGRVRVMLNDNSTRMLLRVEDSGRGIATEALDKIFLPFYQIDDTLARTHPGSGLGLALVRHIAEAHGGQVTARSVLGRGSLFTVVIPRNTSPQS